MDSPSQFSCAHPNPFFLFLWPRKQGIPYAKMVITATARLVLLVSFLINTATSNTIFTVQYMALSLVESKVLFVLDICVQKL